MTALLGRLIGGGRGGPEAGERLLAGLDHLTPPPGGVCLKNDPEGVSPVKPFDGTRVPDLEEVRHLVGRQGDLEAEAPGIRRRVHDEQAVDGQQPQVHLRGGCREKPVGGVEVECPLCPLTALTLLPCSIMFFEPDSTHMIKFATKKFASKPF